MLRLTDYFSCSFPGVHVFHECQSLLDPPDSAGQRIGADRVVPAGHRLGDVVGRDLRQARAAGAHGQGRGAVRGALLERRQSCRPLRKRAPRSGLLKKLLII